MKRILLFIISLLLLGFNLNAQNTNENFSDVNYGGAIDNEVFEASLPDMKLTAESAAKSLPASVDNSSTIYMPPIFDQDTSFSCVQCAEIGYVLTYELNRYRNVAAGTSWEGNGEANENLYHPFFTYNFLNEGSITNGTQLGSGFNIVAENGCPSLVDYWDPILSNLNNPEASRYWMSGSEKYINATENTNTYEPNISPFKITWGSTLSLLDNLKHWLSDHNSGENTGGLAIISVNSGGGFGYTVIPDGSPESGKKILTSWGNNTEKHALTIVGYNDNIHCFDLNNDGVYQNVDKNGNGKIDLNECEKGAFKIANSWGNHYTTTNGYVYVPYKLMAEISDKRAYTCIASEPKDKEIFLSFKMAHPKRNKVTISIAGDNIEYTPRIFNKKGGEYPMNGFVNNPQPIEVSIPCSNNIFDSDTITEYKLIIKDGSNNSLDTNFAYVEELKLIDYRWDEEFVIDSDFGKVNINNNTNTILSVDYDLIPFGKIVENYTCASDKVMRRDVTVKNSTFTINNGVKIDLYGTDDYDCKLDIGNTANLIIGDNAIITAKSGNCEIVIDGNVTIGDNVTFKAENDAVFTVKVISGNSFSIDNCNFENVSLEVDATNPNNPFATNNNVNITNCTFTADYGNMEHAVVISNYPNFSITNNVINGDNDNTRNINDGILVKYSGTNSIISGNSIRGCKYTGLTLYSSKADIKMNQISECGYGVKLLNGSTVDQFTGRCGVLTAEATQNIHDNDTCEVYIYNDCMPETFKYNVITTNKSGYLVIYEDTDTYDELANLTLDFEYNNWGVLNNFQIDSKLFHITDPNNTYAVVFDYQPKWNIETCENITIKQSSYMSMEADSLWHIGEYDMAEEIYKSIISDYPTTFSAENAMKKLLIMESNRDGDYESLQTYYRSDSTIENVEGLNILADFLANKCDENMGNYNEAIAWYEKRIEDETTSYNDSIFATIDLGNLYLKMNDEGLKGIQGKLTQFIPKSREEYSRKTELALRSLKTDKHPATVPLYELPEDFPEDLWTDLVTEQPEGYVVDENGDVHIYSAEALAWLSVLSNGLHGTEVNTYKGVTITLENDIDLSAARWYAIGVNGFEGIFDGNLKVISGFTISTIYAANTSGLFGTLSKAIVRNIIIQDAKVFHYYIDAGLLAGIIRDATIVDNCHASCNYCVMTDMSPFINEIRPYCTVSNCILYAETINHVEYNVLMASYEGFFTGWVGGGSHVSNCASIIGEPHYTMYYGFVGTENSGKIENCYVYLDEFVNGEPPSGHPTREGIVEVNRGEIYNCYYSRDIYFRELESQPFLIDLPYNENYGIVENTFSYADDNGFWQLKESVVFNDNSTDNLLEALNLGAEKLREEGYACLDWKMLEVDFLDTELPTLDFSSLFDNTQELITNNNISVYPNPANDNITIEADDIAQIEIYNTVGQMVERVDVDEDSVEINVSAYNSGIYLMKITLSNGQTYSEKVVVR